MADFKIEINNATNVWEATLICDDNHEARSYWASTDLYDVLDKASQHIQRIVIADVGSCDTGVTPQQLELPLEEGEKS